jgi:hypothetical protein
MPVLRSLRPHASASTATASPPTICVSAKDEGPEGAQLPNCLKVYLPDAAGRFGMVFQLDIVNQRGVLRYLAFGVRHHPADSHAETVYEIADRRLKADDP